MNVNSAATCVCNKRVGKRMLYILMNTLLGLLLSSGSHGLCQVIFSILGGKNCDCQKVLLIGTSALKIVL